VQVEWGRRSPTVIPTTHASSFVDLTVPTNVLCVSFCMSVTADIFSMVDYVMVNNLKNWDVNMF
jgi:hypothetical protein